MQKFMLIDGNSILNRAFYGLPILTNKDGEYTNAVYGFMNMFFRFYDEDVPDYIAVAFDVHAKTFRHLKYDAYKAGRRPTPPELVPQIELLKNLLHKMGIYMAEVSGFEADDIIGTLAQKAETNGLSVVIISGDRDLLQLAGDTTLIRIPTTKSGKTEVKNYYASDVLEKIGVTPKEFVEVKALMGDASDNIPGVYGIGEKTAVKIIQTYKNIEAAIAAASDIKPAKASENLIKYADTARFSRELSEIRIDAPVELNLSAMAADNMYNEEAYTEVARLGFKALLRRFSDIQAPPVKTKAEVCVSAGTARNVIASVLKTSLASFYSVYENGVLTGVCVTSGGEPKTVFINIAGNELYDIIKPLLESNIPKILLDAKKETIHYKRRGIGINNIIFDAALASYVINPSKSANNYGDIAFDYLNESYPPPEELSSCDNAVHCADVLYRAYTPMKERIEQNAQEHLYYDIELPLTAVLSDMETAGIKVDGEKLLVYGSGLSERIDVLQNDIYELTGEAFNINSPTQLGEVLFGKLGLIGGKKTKTGYSTSADVLEKLKFKHPVIPLILEYRTYAKLKSTYVDGLLPLISQDGKIYSTFNQTGTATGRISSSEPNLQNIPIRLELGRKLRKAFIPSDGSFIFMDADYSQIELRVLAHMSRDANLIKAFSQNADIHALTASQVFDVPLEMVTNRQRNSAKAVNFGIIYGISSHGLSEDIGITRKEADAYIKGYFNTYPQVKRFLDDMVAFAKNNGYVETITKRRRYVPEIMSQNFFERAFGERVAMNAPVQGSAADIIKAAMVKVHARLKENGLQSRIVLQVHDELLLEVKKSERDTVRHILKEEMENCIPLLVPLVVDINEGGNWYEAK